jgi:putative transposase
MARKHRIHYPGALYHVILRGNDQRDVFLADVDQTKFCFLLQEGTERFGHRIHAFCFLSNHVHLAMQVGRTASPRIVQNISFRYTQWFNRRYHRSGHLFQGRYRATLVDGDQYLLELVRYIHLNPVRAGLTSDPAAYFWSSYRFYVGRGHLPWLTTDWVLGQFSDNETRAKEQLSRFILDGIDGEAPDELVIERGDGRLLGDDGFTERVLEESEQIDRDKIGIDHIVQAVCEIYQLKEHVLAAPGKDHTASEARSLAAWAVRERPFLLLSELSERFGRDITTLSAQATRIWRRSRRDERLRNRMVILAEELVKRQKRKPDPAAVVIGLGNPFMSDDGIGVHIVRRLSEKAADFPNVEFFDAGSAPMKVLHVIANRDVAILVDCAYLGEPPGTMKRFSPDEVVSRKEQKGISVHEGDLLAILRISRELGELPEKTVVFAIEPAEVKPGDTLSPMLSKRIEDYIALIVEEITMLSTDTS